jgi:hypothetical protein
MFVKLYLLCFCCVLSFQAHAQNELQAARFLTPDEMATYTPSGRSTPDTTQFATFVQNYLLANQQYLETDTNFNSLLRLVPQPQRAAVLASRERVVTEAMDLAWRLRGARGITRDNLLLACEEPSTNFVRSLVSRVNQQFESEDCQNIPLRIGDAVKFRHGGRLQVPSYHVINRIDQNRYKATLNLSFNNPQDPSSGPLMLQKVRKCMQEIGPYLKGPDNQSLSISILTPSEASALPENQRPELYNINVTNENIRGDAQNYRKDFTCETITHEILHLLGLCDEYHENGLFVSEWSCRVHPPGNSIMGDHYKFFPQVVPRTISCRCDLPRCRNFLTTYPQEFIERIANSNNPCQNLAAGSNLEVSRSYGSSSRPQSTHEEGLIHFVNRPTKSSLLTDVHFKRIISGYCQRETPGYSICSQFSQISSTDPRCGDVPVECTSGDYYRGTPR